MKRVAMGVIMLMMNLVIVAALVLPSAAGGGRYRANLSDSDTVEAKNDVRRLDLDLGDGATKMTVRVKARLSRGMLQWRLLDPTGAAREEGEVVPGESTAINRSLTPSKGRWVLEIKFLGATGSYNVNWQVK